MKLSLRSIGLASGLFSLPSFFNEHYALPGYTCDGNNNYIKFPYFLYVNGTEILQTDDIDIKGYELINPFKLDKVEKNQNKNTNFNKRKLYGDEKGDVELSSYLFEGDCHGSSCSLQGTLHSTLTS